MTIEQRLAEIIRSFCADALSSTVNLNVDLDIMLCVLAQALLAAFRTRLGGGDAPPPPPTPPPRRRPAPPPPPPHTNHLRAGCRLNTLPRLAEGLRRSRPVHLPRRPRRPG